MNQKCLRRNGKLRGGIHEVESRRVDARRDRYAGLHSDRVLAVEIIPVAAPTLVARLGVPTCPAELARWPHVHDADRKGWCLWLHAQGIDEIGPPRGPSFDDSSLLLKAVLAGQGAGLLPAAMVALDLEEGRLVKLADVVLLEDFAYYLVYPTLAGERPKVDAFRTWILHAAARDHEMSTVRT